MDINNLTSVYNQNPTLQGQYTLQQYLDLFGQGSSTTPTPDPDPTPDPTPDPGIPNIINQNLNQGGDGGDGGPQPIASPRSTYEKTYAPNLNFAEFTSGVKGTPSFTQEYKEPKNPIEELMELYKTYSPIGFIGKKIEKAKADKISRNETAAAKAKAEREAREKIARAEAAKIEQAKQQAANARNISTATQAFDNTRGQSSSDRGAAAAGMGGGSQQATSAGSSNTDRQDGGWGWADGGSVKKYFKGGVVSLRNGGAPMYSEEDFPILLDPRRPDGSKPSLYDYDGQYDNYDDEVIEIPTGAKMKKPKKKKKKKTKSYFKGGLVSLRGR